MHLISGSGSNPVKSVLNIDLPNFYDVSTHSMNTEILTRVDYLKYLGVIVDQNPGWSSHIFTRVNNLWEILFQIGKLLHFKAERKTVCHFVYRFVFPTLIGSLLFLRVRWRKTLKCFAGDRKLVVVCSIPPNDFPKLFNRHLSACKKFAHKILANPVHPLHDNLSKCPYHVRFPDSLLSPVYRHSYVPCLTRVSTNRDRVAVDQYGNFSWLVILFSLTNLISHSQPGNKCDRIRDWSTGHSRMQKSTQYTVMQYKVGKCELGWNAPTSLKTNGFDVHQRNYPITRLITTIQ